MRTDHYRPNAGEFEGMPIWERSFWLSRAYIEASICLCKAMVNEDFTKQYSSSRVILHLARQGIELFLKAAILRSTTVQSRAGHNLDRLLAEYKKIYSESRFHFYLPSTLSLRQELDLFPETVQSYHSTLDQRHRYATDQKGQEFATPEVFDPTSVLGELEALCKALYVIEFLEIGAARGHAP